jgi:hypothetical protein
VSAALVVGRPVRSAHRHSHRCGSGAARSCASWKPRPESRASSWPNGHASITSPWTAPARIDPAWLREQYLTHRRSYTDTAAELGVADMTVIAAARRHHIPSRPQGVHSRPEMLTKPSPACPPTSAGRSKAA